MQARCQLLPRDIERVVGVHMVGLSEDRPEQAVGGLPQRRASGPADGRALESAIGLEATEELDDQSRLARARLADDADDLGSATLHALESGEELVELVRAADHLSRQPVPGKPSRRSRLGEHADQTVYHHRLRLAAQGQFAGGLEGEAVLGKRVGRIGHQDASRRGRQ